MKYGTVVFDFGQVIGEFTKYDFASLFKLPDEDTELLKKVFFDRYHWDLLDRGAISDDEVKKIFHEKLPKRLHETADRFYDTWICVTPAVDGMDNLIKDLKADGVKLYLLSNFSEQFAKHYTDSPIFSELLGLFDGLVISGTIKTVKPSREIFEYTVNKYGLKPSECLFVDDNEKNIAAGSEVGFATYLFDGDSASLRSFIYGE